MKVPGKDRRGAKLERNVMLFSLYRQIIMYSGNRDEGNGKGVKPSEDMSKVHTNGQVGIPSK